MMPRLLLITAFVVTAAGCSGVEPWVKPYERDHLAEPIMSFDRTPLATEYLAHVYAVREGSRGGQGGSGGGCGCN